MKLDADTVALPGGRFIMGSDRHYPEERPARPAEVGPFRIDRTPVTTAAFACFVSATGYITVAETAPDPRNYPHANPALLTPGSTVFRPNLAARHWGDWWDFTPGAQWRTPDGQAQAEPDHPAVHIAYPDALAYATWAGKSLPTEIEWEYAAHGGHAEYAWGHKLTPDGVHMANIWQGRFPAENLVEDGYLGTSPVARFPPNAYGLFDMIGNVWEWTKDPYHLPDAPRPCCGIGAGNLSSRKHVIKGGSHLCAPNYCRRYRPAARQPQTIDTGTSHLGFRCVVRGSLM